MHELNVFNYEGREVRTVMKDNEPWWVLKDVCAVLEIGNSSDVSKRLDDDEKGVDTIDTLGGPQEIKVISESGLYSVILLSRKHEAKNFKRWITHEVLPSIRKNGIYATSSAAADLLSNPRKLAELLIEFANTQDRLNQSEQHKNRLQIALDESKDWFTVKRVAALNGVSWKDISWKRLKNTSDYLNYDVKKIFDANYGAVNAYHINVWQREYPEFDYDEEDI